MSKTNYVIIHGQLVEVSDDVLMHWKYIKREKKNGRWVYYYDQSAYDNSIAVKDYEVKKQLLKKAEQQSMRDNVNYRVNSKLNSTDWKTEHELAEKAIQSKIKYYDLKASAKEAEKRYKNAQIRTFAARTISKGAVKVANLFSKLFSKKK